MIPVSNDINSAAKVLAELPNLPPKPPRSKLEPQRELIRELRRGGRTYREVARLFQDRLGFHVAPSTLHSFVEVRAQHRKQVQFELPPLASHEIQAVPSSRLACLQGNACQRRDETCSLQLP